MDTRGLSRRRLLQTVGLGAAALALPRGARSADGGGRRPNILFIIADDLLPSPVLGSNLPLRGWKGQLYEGGIRVPTVVNRPGTLQPGAVDAPVHIVDWMPTFCNVD